MIIRILLWAYLIFVGLPLLIIMAGLGYGGVMEFLKWINT